MMRLHVRAPTGTRIEQTECIVDNIERDDPHGHSAAELDEHQRQHRPADFLRSGLLSDRQHRPAGRRRADPAQARASADRGVPASRSARCWRTQFPDVTGLFPGRRYRQPGAELRSAGARSTCRSPATICKPITRSRCACKSGWSAFPGSPTCASPSRSTIRRFEVNVDRAKALELGITQQQVASQPARPRSAAQLLLQPNFWLDPESGVNYNVIAQTPQHLVDSVGAADIPLSTTPLERAPRSTASAARAAQPQLLGNVATVSARRRSRGHRPLHRAARDRRRLPASRAATSAASPPRCSARSTRSASCRPAPQIMIRGQSQAMRESFATLGEGLVLAIILVYLLMVANFQSWLEPFIIMMAVPGALAGVLWMLVLTRHDDQRRIADGRDHGGRRRRRQRQPADHLRQRTARGGLQSGRGGDRGRAHPPASDPDDRARDDPRDAADGAGAGRGRRAERAAGPRRDRRTDRGDR